MRPRFSSINLLVLSRLALINFTSPKFPFFGGRGGGVRGARTGGAWELSLLCGQQITKIIILR